MIVGTFQSAVLQAQTVSQGKGVGGLVLGVRLDSAGIHWIRDTNYVVYGDLDGSVDLIQVRHRPGGFSVSSPNLEMMTLCITKWDEREWEDRWGQSLFELNFHKLASNWMFISYQGFGGVLVQDPEPFNVCHLFDARPKEQGLTGLAISESFQRLLRGVVRRPEAPQFACAHKANCVAVLAQALYELEGIDIAATLESWSTGVRVEARSSKWHYKPFDTLGN